MNTLKLRLSTLLCGLSLAFNTSSAFGQYPAPVPQLKFATSNYPIEPLVWDIVQPWHPYPRDELPYRPGKVVKPPLDAWVPAIIKTQPKSIQEEWVRLREVDLLNQLRNPKLPHPYMARAELWLQVRDRDDGIADLAAAAEQASRADLDPGDREQMLSNLKETSSKMLKIEQVILNRAGAMEAYTHARESIRDRDYKRALQQLTDAVDLNSSDPVFWYYRAAVNLWLGQQDEAIHDARSGAAAERYYTHNGKGSISTRLEGLQGKARDFVQGFREGLMVNRFLGSGTRGEEYVLRLASDQSAEEKVRELIRKLDRTAKPEEEEEPKEPEVKFESDIPAPIQQLPVSLQKKWLTLTGLMKKHPDVIEIYNARALIWETAQSYEEALKDHLESFNRAVAAGPNKSKEQLDTLTRALALLNRMPYPIEASSPSKHFWTGYEAYFLGDLKKALGCFDFAVQQSPLEPLHWYYRALTYKRMGDDAKAVRDARIGAQLEKRSQSPETINERLVRVQGPIREWLSGIRRSREPSPLDK